METTAVGTQKVIPDFNEGIVWHEGVNLSLNLLPVEKKGKVLSSFSDKEVHAFSWALGLLAASAIKEHEKVLNELREVAYPEGKLEGLQFFLEEAVHSQAYTDFLAMSAAEMNLSLEELLSFLPKYERNSIITKIYEFEAAIGGRAIWWTVAATEEESIRLYQKLSPHKSSTDPVFFTLNHAHFIEESRHSSFSYKMLKRKGNFLTKFSFGLSRVLQTAWLMKELSSFKNVRNFRNRHPMLETMAVISEKFEALPLKEKLTLLFRDISYTKMLSQPESHPRLLRALKSENVIMFRLPEVK